LADGQGFSLQLIDSTQDNSRVSNWDGSVSRAGARISVTGQRERIGLLLYLDNVGDVYVDDMSLVEGNIPENYRT